MSTESRCHRKSFSLNSIQLCSRNFLSFRWSEELNHTIVNITTPSMLKNTDLVAALQTSNGTLLRCSGGESVSERSVVEEWCFGGRPVKFPQMCSQMALCKMDGQVRCSKSLIK